MQRTRVKICGITRVEDIKCCELHGVDALGFVFVDSSPRSITIDQAKALVASVPPFIQTVGLFMNDSSDFIGAVLNQVPLNLLQFHGDESSPFCESFNVDYIKAVPMGGGVDPSDYAAQYPNCKGFLLDSHGLGQSGGSGGTFDWQSIPENLSKPVILAGGLTTENVASAIKQVKPYAVDVSSGVEAAKGIKDQEKIAAFIRGVKQGDESRN